MTLNYVTIEVDRDIFKQIIKTPSNHRTVLRPGEEERLMFDFFDEQNCICLIEKLPTKRDK